MKGEGACAFYASFGQTELDNVIQDLPGPATQADEDKRRRLGETHLVVYGNDHRGHGLTAKVSGSFGDFGPGGFDQLVEDMVSLRVITKRSS